MGKKNRKKVGTKMEKVRVDNEEESGKEKKGKWDTNLKCKWSS